MATEPARTRLPDLPDAPAIELSGLHKSYGTTKAVAGVDLVVQHGEVVAFLGPNGAGKSTTVDMMLGLSTPDAGTVKLFGRTPTEAIAQGWIGAMLQTGGAVRSCSPSVSWST